MIVRGAIVPHAPVLIESLQPSLEAGGRLRSAISELDFAQVETIVVVSPHGESSGVYSRPRGNLDGFGVAGVTVSRRADAELGSDLAEHWQRPLQDMDADFGIVVPLALGLGGDLPVVAVALPEITGPLASPAPEAIGDALTLASSLTSIADHRDIAIVASAHSSAALNARAPLTEREGAADLEESLAEALRHDPGAIEPLLDGLHRVGDACGVAPLAAFSRLLGEWRCRTLRSESPFGVGYLVGEWAA